MSQIYTDPKREKDPHALPNAEVFYIRKEDRAEGEEPSETGWYWWPCFPGCMPDGDPDGPYATEQEAIDAAREGADDEIDPDSHENRRRVMETLRAMFEHAGAPDYRAAMREDLKLGSWAALDERIQEAREAVETIMGEG